MSAAARIVRNPALVLACRWLLAAVMLWAGLAKIGDLRTFAGDVHNFRMLPVALEHLVALSLPWIEVVCGLGLITGIRGRAAAMVSLGLMVLFTVAVAQALGRGLDIDCGCFGTSDATRVGWIKLAQNVGLTVAAAIGTVRRG